MKVLIADGLSADAVAALKRLGLGRGPPRPEGGNAARGPGRRRHPHRPLDQGDGRGLQAAPQLSLIVATGPGTGGIDLAAASGRGIYVAHCPGNDAADVVLSVELFLKTGHPIGTINLCARPRRSIGWWSAI